MKTVAVSGCLFEVVWFPEYLKVEGQAKPLEMAPCGKTSPLYTGGRRPL